MLESKVIIYDDSCPMCKLYTYWFVAWGFLAPENRIGFATAPANIISHVDLDRGRHEIPLFDRNHQRNDLWPQSAHVRAGQSLDMAQAIL